MKTLTITEAKKNLGKWLTAAVRGEDVGIISGAAIVALHPVEIQAKPWHEAMPVDREYIRKEYGMTPEQMETVLDRLADQSERSVRAGGAIVIENPTLENLEKALGDYTRTHPATRRTAKKRARGRVARAA